MGRRLPRAEWNGVGAFLFEGSGMMGEDGSIFEIPGKSERRNSGTSFV